jgi:hypothetical protein
MEYPNPKLTHLTKREILDDLNYYAEIGIEETANRFCHSYGVELNPEFTKKALLSLLKNADKVINREANFAQVSDADFAIDTPDDYLALKGFVLYLGYKFNKRPSAFLQAVSGQFGRYLDAENAFFTVEELTSLIKTGGESYLVSYAVPSREGIYFRQEDGAGLPKGWVSDFLPDRVKFSPPESSPSTDGAVMPAVIEWIERNNGRFYLEVVTTENEPSPFFPQFTRKLTPNRFFSEIEKAGGKVEEITYNPDTNILSVECPKGKVTLIPEYDYLSMLSKAELADLLIGKIGHDRKYFKFALSEYLGGKSYDALIQAPEVFYSKPELVHLITADDLLSSLPVVQSRAKEWYDACVKKQIEANRNIRRHLGRE